MAILLIDLIVTCVKTLTKFHSGLKKIVLSSENHKVCCNQELRDELDALYEGQIIAGNNLFSLQNYTKLSFRAGHSNSLEPMPNL